MTNTNLINDLQATTHDTNSVATNFIDFLAVLHQYQQTDLIEYATATGITNFKNAREWFTDYFINDEAEGPAMKAKITQQINTAEHDETRNRALWYTDPDYKYGYAYTPTDFVPVPDQDLTDIMADVIERVKNGQTTYKQLVAFLKEG